MPKDIRKITKDFKEEQLTLSKNHEEKFLKRLTEEFPKKKKSYRWMYAVASVILLIGLGVTFYNKSTNITPIDIETEIEPMSLGDISPEMKKIESYYLTAIHYEIASLEVTTENKALLDVYLEKLSKLDVDYKRLNKNLEKGILNNKTINALITNLQLRLQLLIQLKDQVNDLQSKENKNENINA